MFHDKHDGGRKVPINGGQPPEAKDADKAAEHTPEHAPEDSAAVHVHEPATKEDIAAIRAEFDKLREKASELDAKAKDAEDKYLRLYAETDNFKKRMTRDFSEREKFCNEGIIKDLLPVLDNLERALAHAGEAGGSDALTEGVQMVRKQLVDALAKNGVTQVESIGLPFDPAKQQAMMQVETGP
ncbi:MAG: nucleotide exchange factor GrpE [Nitrospirae bacterium]|nr:nucleotide exchange factor GrpE [Nitrospirota bacterium]